MKITFFILITIPLIISPTIYSQNKDEIKSLYHKRDYANIIAILNLKSTKKELTLNEYYFLAKSYGKLKKYNNGLAYAEKMIQKAILAKDTSNLLRSFNLKAENLIDLDKIKEGVRFCDSVNVFFKKKDSIEFQKLCFKWGMLHYQNKNYKKAFNVYNKITKKEYRALSLFLHNYALTLEGLKKYDEAILYLKKDIANKTKSKQKNKAYISQANIANIYLKQGMLKKAKKHLDIARNYPQKNLQKFHKKHLLENYYKYFYKQNKLDSAKVYLDEIEKLNNVIFTKKLNEEIDELKISYQKEKKLFDQIQTEKDRSLSLEKEKLKLSVLAVFALVFLALLLFYYSYKNIRIKYKNLKLEQKMLHSQITPHFIFNSFSVLQGIILNKENDKASRYVSKFSKLMRAMLDNSRNEFVLLSDEIEILENYIDLQNMKSKNSINYSLNTSNNIIQNSIYIPSMLIQPLIENSIKHGFTEEIKRPEIKVNFSLKEKKLLCTIIDNGIGIEQVQKQTKTNSVGTLITKERLIFLAREHKQGFYLKIKDLKSIGKQGTKAVITLPYKTTKNA